MEEAELRTLGATLSSLARDRRAVTDAISRATGQLGTLAGAEVASAGPLAQVTDFGSNPGQLLMHAYVPPALAPAPHWW